MPSAGRRRDAERRRRCCRRTGLTFVLVAAAFAAYAFVPSGLSAHLLAIFGRTGIDAGDRGVDRRAVRAGAGRRAADRVRLRPQRASALGRALAVGALLVAFALLALFGISTPTAAAFALMFGGANGLVTIARGAVPLALFGAGGYGRLMGRLAAASCWCSRRRRW